MKNLVTIFYMLILASCAGVSQKLSTTVKYKKDVTFYVNKKRIKGMGSVLPAIEYDIEIDYKFGKMDLLTLSTCHREIQIEGEGTSAKYTFKPTPVEIERNCILDLGIYDKKGRHGWGYLIFNNYGHSLMAEIQCNGSVSEYKGVSACQSQIGTVQRIRFDKIVAFTTSEEACELIQKGNEFEYTMASDYCYFSFADSDGNFHDHTAYGYETYIIRE